MRAGIGPCWRPGGAPVPPARHPPQDPAAAAVSGTRRPRPDRQVRWSADIVHAGGAVEYLFWLHAARLK